MRYVFGLGASKCRTTRAAYFGYSFDNKSKQFSKPWRASILPTAEVGQKKREREAYAHSAQNKLELLAKLPIWKLRRVSRLFANFRMKSHIQFITTPTSDTPGTALLLHFDDKRYIIGNIHEGLQRAGLQLGTKNLKAKDLFLTGRTEWLTNGGLLGMILTLADAANARAESKKEIIRQKIERAKAREEGDSQRRKRSKKSDSEATQQPVLLPGTQYVEDDPTVTLHGGPNLTHMLATARSFIFRKGTPIKVIEHTEEEQESSIDRDWKPTWADNRIQVWAMPIEPTHSENTSTGLRPVSPRKRSLGEFLTGQGPTSSEPADRSSIQPNPPENQEVYDQTTRRFVVSEMFGSAWRYGNLTEMPLHEVHLPATLFIRDPETKQLRKYTGPMPDGTSPVPDVKVLVRQPWPGALIDHLPPTKPSATAMSYIIRSQRQRGKFKPDEARARKVPPGPLWAQLAAGLDVQSSDGVTVTPQMVLGAEKEGNGIAVVDLPSQEYVHDLANREEWKAERVMTGVGAIVWILGPGVIQNETLSGFIRSHPNLQHILSSPDHCPNYLSMTSAASGAIRHNQIDPVHYSLPVHSNAPSSQADLGFAVPEATTRHTVPAERGLKIELEPSFVLKQDDIVPLLNTALLLQQTPGEVLNLAEAARRELASEGSQTETANQGLPSQDAEIICLGTGSALPSPYRNVSATLLRVPGCGSYLLDCGENTLGQLKRVYAPAQLAEVLRDLKMIWISHLHADHHLGTTSVIKAWYEELHGRDLVKRRRPSLTEQLLDSANFLNEGKRLFVVGHGHMMRWLKEYSSVEDYGYDQIVPLKSFVANPRAPDLCNLEWNGVNVGFNTSKDPKV